MPPRKRTNPPAGLSEKRPANDLDALREEVAAEPEAAPVKTYRVVPFAGTVVRILDDFWEWPAVTSDLIAVGRFTQAAAQIVHPDDYNSVWAKANPTNGQVRDFVAEVEKVIGIPLTMLLTSLGS